jgi:hypothetical protein
MRLRAAQSRTKRLGMRAILTHIAERDEPPPTLVPKHQPDALEAPNEREPTGGTRQALFARIEQLIDEVRFNSDIPSQKM